MQNMSKLCANFSKAKDMSFLRIESGFYTLVSFHATKLLEYSDVMIG